VDCLVWVDEFVLGKYYMFLGYRTKSEPDYTVVESYFTGTIIHWAGNAKVAPTFVAMHGLTAMAVDCDFVFREITEEEAMALKMARVY